jgi:hypothetical protein
LVPENWELDYEIIVNGGATWRKVFDSEEKVLAE